LALEACRSALSGLLAGNSLAGRSTHPSCGILSGLAQKQAIETLQLAHKKSEALAKTGMFFEFSSLANAHVPHPQAWAASYQVEHELDVTGMGRSELDKILQQHGKTNKDIVERNTVIKLQPPPDLQLKNVPRFISDYMDLSDRVTETNKRKLLLPIQSRRIHIHNGDEFVNLESDVGIMSIRWSSVESYSPPAQTTREC
jgi:hypothetical protein